MITLLACLVVQGGTEPVTLLLKPTKGMTIRQRTVLTCDLQMGGDQVTMEAIRVSAKKCVEVRADGTVTLEVRFSELKITIDGTPVPKQGEESPLTILLSANGEPRTFVGAVTPRANELEILGAMRVVFPEKPVSKGGSWTFKRAPDPTAGTGATETVYQFEGVETVDGKPANKITFVHSRAEGSTGVTSVGTAWLDPNDGMEIKGDYLLKSVDFGSGMIAKEAHFKLTRLQ